jgi:hypothetical protein
MEYKIGDRNGCIEIVSNPIIKPKNWGPNKKAIFYNVRCDCGNCFEMQMGNFKKSLGKYCVKCRAQGQTFHTKETKRLHKTWSGMKERCYDKKSSNYHNYGGRGISIFKEWLNSFESFRDWALANGYSNDLTIDRIDNNGNYQPSNCRWSTNMEQQRNRRNNVWFEIDGEKILLADALKKYNIKMQTLSPRLKKGYSLIDALTLPIGSLRGKHKEPLV